MKFIILAMIFCTHIYAQGMTLTGFYQEKEFSDERQCEVTFLKHDLKGDNIVEVKLEGFAYDEVYEGVLSLEVRNRTAKYKGILSGNLNDARVELSKKGQTLKVTRLDELGVKRSTITCRDLSLDYY